MNEVLLAYIKNLQPYVIGGIFLLVFLAEHIFPQRKDIIDNKHDLFNVAVGILNAFFAFFFGYYFQILLDLCNKTGFGLMNLIALPLLIRFIIEFILMDIWMYGWHLLNHQIRWLWYFHRFHHLDTKLNSTSAVRFHTGELILSMLFKMAIFTLLGLSVFTLFIYGIILFAVIVSHHSNIRLSDSLDFRLRAWIVSPKMHRIHHSVIIEETNSNYGSVFPFWDKIFKTYTAKPSKDIQFGTK